MNRRNRFFLILTFLMLMIVPALISVETVDAQILGTNWTGSFFNNTTLSGQPVATANFPEGLSCNWTNGVNNCSRSGTAVPILGVNQQNFSGIFTSIQTLTQSGDYLFTLRYNDGMRFTINGIVVHDDLTQLTTPDTSGACTDRCKQVQITQRLDAGPVNMSVDYVQFTGDAYLQVQWGFFGGFSFLVNGDFEQGLDGWTLTNGSSDKVKCDTATKTVAFKGKCAFRFKGVPGERAKLVQKSDSLLYVSGTLELNGYVNAEGSVDTTVKLMVIYPGSKRPSDKLIFDIVNETGGSYVPLSDFQSPLTVQAVQFPMKIKLTLNNRGESDKVFYDKLTVVMSSYATRQPLVLQPLP